MHDANGRYGVERARLDGQLLADLLAIADGRIVPPRGLQGVVGDVRADQFRELACDVLMDQAHAAADVEQTHLRGLASSPPQNFEQPLRLAAREEALFDAGKRNGAVHLRDVVGIGIDRPARVGSRRSAVAINGRHQRFPHKSSFPELVCPA